MYHKCIIRNKNIDCKKCFSLCSSKYSRVLFQPVCSTKEYRGVQTSIRPQSPEPVYSLSHIPDGDSSLHQAAAAGWRIHHLHRPGRCLSPCTNISRLPALSPNSGTRPSLAISGNALWPEYCTPDLYQPPGSSGRHIAGSGDPGAQVPGRLADPSLICPGGPATHRPSDPAVPQPRLTGPSGKIRSGAPNRLCVSGSAFQSGSRHGGSSGRQNPESHSIGQHHSASVPYPDQTSSTPDWGYQSHGRFYSTRPSLCPTSPVFSTEPPERSQRRLGPLGQHPPYPAEGPLALDRSAVAGGQCAITHASSHTNSGHRRQSGGLGGPYGRPASFRTLVPPRIPVAHLSVRDPGRAPGIRGSARPSLRHLSPDHDGQYGGRSLHSQTGGHSVSPTLSRGQRPPAVVSPAPGSCNPSLFTRPPECLGRPSVKAPSSPLHRVDPPATSVSATPISLSPDGDRPIRHSLEQQTPEVCVTVSRPSGRGFGCTDGRVGLPPGLCISPLRHHPGGSPQSGSVGHVLRPGRPLVADPGLVPGGSPIASGTSSPTASLPQVVVPASPAGIPSPARLAQPSRLATIRQRFREEGLSGRAADLAASYLRPSSTRLYQSHWRTFTSWCREHGLDPLHPSIAVMADFLVHLHEDKGFAPATVASYRSSLAGTLGAIDGVPLGQHPIISRLIRSMTIQHPRARPRVPAWDLTCVLDFLASKPAPTSLQLRADRTFMTLKLAFLLALASGKRRSELQALSRDPRDLRVTADGVWLRTVAGFLPKTSVPGHDPAPFFIPSLVPTVDTRERDLRLCPVSCLTSYVQLTGGLQEGRLFHKIRGAGPPSVDSVSRWITQCIRLAHDTDALPAHAHEVRRMAASWAYQAGHHSLEEILLAGWWASQSTFTRFYLAHLHPQPDGLFRLTPVVAGRQIPVG